jgi:hypothetical protein
LEQVSQLVSNPVQQGSSDWPLRMAAAMPKRLPSVLLSQPEPWILLQWMLVLPPQIWRLVLLSFPHQFPQIR